MAPSPSWRVVQLPIAHPDAALLVEEVQQEYVARYGGRDETPLEPGYFEAPLGAFFVGYLDGRPVATGAWRRRRDVVVDGCDDAAEVKRMYVAPGARRRGLARAMLAHLEQTAHAAGAQVMVLETGLAQPEAISLYESSGYVLVPGFGHYKDAPLSRCMARRLGETPAPDPWDDQAAGFDREPDHGLLDQDTRAAWRRLLLAALPAAPARVLDVGCGTGSLSVLLAEEGYEVRGLDRSPAMVTLARAKAAAAGVRADFGVADVAEPPVRAGSCDVVLSRHVLWTLPDPVAVLGRWAEAAGPDPTLLLVEGRWHTGAGLAAHETVAIADRAGLGAAVTALVDPALWGGPTDDERYLVVARRRGGGPPG